MNQVGSIENTHNAAMNTLMSKYQDTLMLADAAKRKKDELLDSAGMELIQAGLGSGRLHKFGHHLAGRIIGKRALKHTANAIKEAVGAYKKRGSLADVVSHFANKKGGLSSRAVRALDPSGRIAKLHAELRSTYSSAEEAAKALGAEHEATIKEAYETARRGPQSALNAGRDKANQLAGDAKDKTEAIAQAAKDKAEALAKDAEDKANALQEAGQKRVKAVKKKAGAVKKKAAAAIDTTKKKAGAAIDDAKGQAGGAIEGAAEKARRLKFEAEAGVANARGAVKKTTGAGSTILSSSAAGAEEAARRLRETAGAGIQDERVGKEVRKVKKRAEQARITAQRMKDAKDLQARVLKEREASLNRPAEAAQPKPEKPAQPKPAPEQPEAEQPEAAQPEAEQPVEAEPDTTESSVKRSTGLGGFLNDPEEEARLERQRPKGPIKLANGTIDPFSGPKKIRKQRPSYRIPSIRKRPVDPVQARMAKHAEVSKALAAAKINLEASQAKNQLENESKKTRSWSIRRPIKDGRQERANPTTIRNPLLDSREARSVNRTVAERPAGFELPDFETASKQVAQAPQSLMQSVRRAVMGQQAKPPPRAATAFAPEKLIARANARQAYSSQATIGEADDQRFNSNMDEDEKFNFSPLEEL